MGGELLSLLDFLVQAGGAPLLAVPVDQFLPHPLPHPPLALTAKRICSKSACGMPHSGQRLCAHRPPETGWRAEAIPSADWSVAFVFMKPLSWSPLFHRTRRRRNRLPAAPVGHPVGC